MIPLYLFPYGQVRQGASVVIYGAGYCGKQFVKQLLASQYANIALWVDRDYIKIREREYLNVSSPDELTKHCFDYVVIALTSPNVAAQVCEYLVKNYGIEREKLVYYTELVTDVDLFRKYSLMFNKNKDEKASDDLYEIEPKMLVRSSNVDVGVRYLLARDFRNGIKNLDHLSLYCRTMLAVTGGTTQFYQGQLVEKKGTKDFLDNFHKLFVQMAEKGYESKYFIPVRKDTFSMIDGSHRLASAIALENKIWIKHFSDDTTPYSYPFQWFKDSGFNNEDQLRILRAYSEIYPRCSMAIIWGTFYSHWEYITKMFGENLNVVGFVDLDFSNNYIAFENLIREIYNDSLCEDSEVDRKINYLKMAPLKLRVALLTDENQEEQDVYVLTKNAMAKISNTLLFEQPSFLTGLYASTCFDEFKMARNVILSANNLKSVSNRVNRGYSRSFIQNLKEAKIFLSERGIPVDKCLIIGKGVLEAYGLNFEQEVYIVYGKEYMSSGIHKYDKLSKLRIDCLESFVFEGECFNIDIMIEDDEYHFMFDGFKFLNIEITKKYLKSLNSEEDEFNIRLIDIYEDFALYFEDKKALQKQVNEHIRSRF